MDQNLVNAVEQEQQERNPSTLLESLRSELLAVNRASGQVANFERAPGLRGSLIFLFRRLLRRMLTWYTRPIHEYQLHVTQALNLASESLIHAAASLQQITAHLYDLDAKFHRNLSNVEGNVEKAFQELHEVQTLEIPRQLRLTERYIAKLQRLVSQGQRAENAILAASQVVPVPRKPLNERAKAFTFGVNVAGHLRSEKGVGQAARASVRSLKAAGIPLAFNDFVDFRSYNMEVGPIGAAGNPYRYNLLHMNAEDLGFFARGQSDYLKDRFNIGFWNWELESFPWEWYGKFRYLDEVWVPSSFTYHALKAISPIPVLQVPYSIDPAIEDPPVWQRCQFHLPEEAFIFLFVFDLQSYVERKNPFGLIDAFTRAFGGRRDVLLVLKCSHADYAPAQAEALSANTSPNVKIITDAMSRRVLFALLHRADVYVSLHRSEGFGLTIAEAMALGKPTIATGYSANLDFMNPANSYLVRSDLVEIDEDYGVYHQGSVWANPDLDHAATLMREVFENREEAAHRGRRAKADIWSQLHPDVVGKLMYSSLRELENC